MDDLKIIGLDLAKDFFSVVGINEKGKKMLTKTLQRSELISFFGELPHRNVLIAMEACGTSHYWARVLADLGFKCKLYKTRDVKVYARLRPKNDRNDALAIAKTASDPELQSVMVKSPHQQDVQLLHTRRQQLTKQRIEASNALRALLAEYGVYIKASPTLFLKQAPAFVEKAHADKLISPMAYQHVFLPMIELLQSFISHLDALDKIILQLSKDSLQAQRLQQIPGIGPIIASIFDAIAVDWYSSSRDFAASLGLVPSQHSTGGQTTLGRITKSGNRYVRTLLIQGARTILMRLVYHLKALSKDAFLAYLDSSPLLKWAYALWQRNGFNKAAVAIANKLARIAWAITTKALNYNEASAFASKA